MTTPRRTLVRVPSQRSMVSQIVPRTVAALYRPRVRKRPLALERRRRIASRLSAADARLLVLRAHGRKLAPFSGRSVSPLRNWSAWKTPAEKMPVKNWPFLVEALVRLTDPLRVSRYEPTGSWRAAVRGTNRRPLSPGTDRLANAPAAGTLTNTFPLV